MAITCNGVTASLHASGDELPSHGVKQETGSVSCFVPSQVDTALGIYVYNSHPETGMVCVVFMDGRPMEKIGLYPNDSVFLPGVYGEENTLRPFRVVKLRTKEDDNGGSIDTRELGVIELKVYRANIKPSARADAARSSSCHLQAELDPVPERSKKAGYHVVSLGEPTKMEQTMRFCSVMLMESEKESPYAVFRFTCMPKDMLQARGILDSCAQAGNTMFQTSLKREAEDCTNGQEPRKKARQTQDDGVRAAKSSRSKDVQIIDLTDL